MSDRHNYIQNVIQYAVLNIMGKASNLHLRIYVLRCFIKMKELGWE